LGWVLFLFVVGGRRKRKERTGSEVKIGRVIFGGIYGWVGMLKKKKEKKKRRMKWMKRRVFVCVSDWWWNWVKRR